jgi:hypothetical protein
LTEITPGLQRLLDAAGPGGIKSLTHLERLIRKTGFTGPTTIHWLGGRPRQLDLGQPVRLTIVEGGLDTEAPTRGG